MVKAVIFDLDGTLLNRDASVQKFIGYQYERLREYLRHIPKEKYISRFIELDCHGYVWKDKVYQQMVQEFSIQKMSWQDLLSDYVEEFQYSCVGFPNLIQMLTQLQGVVSLGIITNGKGIFQMDNIKALKIDPYFSSILISEWEGMSKPNPELFQKAALDLGVSVRECIYIGDHPINDIKGAEAVGMKTIWKKNPFWDKVETDYVIEDLSEIPHYVSTNIQWR
ncbi:HAD family hydrolase [Lederbergia sp. NSJ-179]|uniref:HAD family hydrolase n=1 Tax=Lederbergia sp. NSJ-179 TaxID=2931402 RepID=UPI001FD471E8|nr:HAD family hydrolase [Lederbergia sp. NSJ-179]MCJ7840027.1 HAD family hydrolase [Lederbergia sp. NSJ-179]